MLARVKVIFLDRLIATVDVADITGPRFVRSIIADFAILALLPAVNGLLDVGLSIWDFEHPRN